MIATAAYGPPGVSLSRRNVVARCIAASPGGLTTDEVAEILDWLPNRVAARVTELHRQREIRTTGEFRCSRYGTLQPVWIKP